jgi:hypothetical protein
VDVYFLGNEKIAQIACLELMAKKIAVSQLTSGDMPDTGLDVLNIEVALAKTTDYCLTFIPPVYGGLLLDHLT